MSNTSFDTSLLTLFISILKLMVFFKLSNLIFFQNILKPQIGFIFVCFFYFICIYTDVIDCVYGGKKYKSGQHFNKGDNCNTCVCANTGDVRCTDQACAMGEHFTIQFSRLPLGLILFYFHFYSFLLIMFTIKDSQTKSLYYFGLIETKTRLINIVSLLHILILFILQLPQHNLPAFKTEFKKRHISTSYPTK